MFEPAACILGADRGQAGGDGGLQRLLGACLGFAQALLELGEGVFDWG